MKKKKISRVIERRFKKLNHYRKLILQDYAPEDIHGFRVNYKKLKAFLWMLHAVHNKVPAISHKLKKTYKHCGYIRDFQLQVLRYQKTEKTKEDALYIEALQQNIEYAKQKTSKLLSKKIERKSKFKKRSSIQRKFGTKDYEKYLKIIQHQIQEILLQHHFSDTTLHSVRKKLKVLFYNSKYFENENLNVKEAQQIKYGSYKKLTVALGNFQDLYNAIRLLQPALYPFLNTLKQSWLIHQKNILSPQKAASKKILISELKMISNDL